MTKGDKIEKLIQYDIDRMDWETVMEILDEGCQGYSNMSDDEINGYYTNII